MSESPRPPLDVLKGSVDAFLSFSCLGQQSVGFAMSYFTAVKTISARAFFSAPFVMLIY